MVKVLIKKNIKPKTTNLKQKQKQTQTVNINIGDTFTKKKRGRPARRSKLEKQPTKPSSQQPITQSYNQPIFKQSNPQPSSLASSILATQLTPKVVAFRGITVVKEVSINSVLANVIFGI